MPVYNGERFLAEAIESILRQTYTNLELLIVDDGSSDKSASIARAYEARDGRIRFFQLERNMGKADARNVGCFAAQGEFITGMDCDDISLPRRIENQLSILRTCPEIGGVGTCGEVIDADGISILNKYVVPQRHALILLYWFIGESVLGATLMLRREYFYAVGGYEPGRRAVDDLDLLARLFSQTEIQLANLPDLLYLYRWHELSKLKHRGSEIRSQDRQLKLRMLAELWGDVPEDVLDRFDQLRMHKKLDRKLGWRERRSAKRYLKRLIDAMIHHGWVVPEDEPLLIAEINRLLERASPRIWQQFCHWRRHRFSHGERT